MIYKFILAYTPTNPNNRSSQQEVYPSYGDDLATILEMKSDEWFRTRKLEGSLTFERADYEFIMRCAFDGTFTLTIKSSTDQGATWQSYFEGTFSRANLEIDEDNQLAVLHGLDEGGEYNVIENGKDEEYDLMKLIPDIETKEVQGQVHPALAMVDYRSDTITQSDIFCDAPNVAGGYLEGKNNWTINTDIRSDQSWNFIGLFVEAYVEMHDSTSDKNGYYAGMVTYGSHTSDGHTVYGPVGEWNSIKNKNNCSLQIDFSLATPYNNGVYPTMRIWNSDGTAYSAETLSWVDAGDGFFTPSSLLFSDGSTYYKKVTFYFHYIRATLLTQSQTVAENVLDTGDYYKWMEAFEGSGLNVVITTNTVEQPNGHRLLPGTGEQGTIPKYYAQPDESHNWIPLAEDTWQYASMWYTIEPSHANGLLNPSKFGSFRWTRCWSLGTCLKWLLRKITNNKVTFDETESASQFLYATVNPVTNGEQFSYLFTQKSNVMRPSNGGESAARCIVRLQWFLEFLRNGLNCYWWLEERNGGTYAFRVEHVEWFRRGGSYTGQLDAQINLTEIKPIRNFLRNGEAAKRLDDNLHKYTYNLEGMTEKYTFSWQGDGGSDDFKGNPMFFKAGWVEKGSSESHEVDNIFADLNWLMLNAGSDTESSKNYDGIFVFGAYIAGVSPWIENVEYSGQYLQLAEGRHLVAFMNIWLTIPEGQTVTLVKDTEVLDTYTGTGEKQMITVAFDSLYISGEHWLGLDFGDESSGVFVHRVHAFGGGNLYNVPNMENMFRGGYLQNGTMAWPWLQNAYLHYDIPAQQWSYDNDDIEEATFIPTGTVKMVKTQSIPILPMPSRCYEDKLEKGVIGGLRDSQLQLQTGIVETAKINLTSRNAELTLKYDIN